MKLFNVYQFTSGNVDWGMVIKTTKEDIYTIDYSGVQLTFDIMSNMNVY